MTRYDLTRVSAVRSVLISRWPQFIVRTVALAGFVWAILAGWFGTPVGSRNFSIIVVWIAWWALLILLAVPFSGRSWCSICPIPLPGEWLQQGAIFDPPKNSSSRRGRRRWPKALRNTWLQNGAFIVLALISAVVLTQPRVTAVLLALLLLLAVVTSLAFERRTFCRHLCPVGGFIGLYSQLSPVELRVKNAAVCAAHPDKTCYTGTCSGYGCPWNAFPAGMTKNTYCGLCMECLRTCPYDNVAVNVRPFGADLLRAGGRKLDETFKALIMVGSAAVYSAVMLGPWTGLKAAAYSLGSTAWWGYAGVFLLVTLAAVPGLFYLAAWSGNALARARSTARQSFIGLGPSLIPLGLAAWIAFSLSFVLANGSYLWAVLSDPMGWGWDLLGGAHTAWTPYLSGAVPTLQAAVLLGGLVWACVITTRIAKQKEGSGRATRYALPVVLFHLVATVGMLWLLIG